MAVRAHLPSSLSLHPPACTGSAAGMALLALLAVTVLSACGGEDGNTVTIKGSMGNLDSIAAIGDSMVLGTRTARAPSLDSIRLAVEADLDAGALAMVSGAGNGVLESAELLSGTLPIRAQGSGSAPSAAEMSRRAQARGDSIARAISSRAMSDGAAGRSRADSVRGVLELLRTGSMSQVVLRTGDATISLSGLATSGMSAKIGREVMVYGLKVTPRDMVVSDYTIIE